MPFSAFLLRSRRSRLGRLLQRVSPMPPPPSFPPTSQYSGCVGRLPPPSEPYFGQFFSPSVSPRFSNGGRDQASVGREQTPPLAMPLAALFQRPSTFHRASAPRIGRAPVTWRCRPSLADRGSRKGRGEGRRYKTPRSGGRAVGEAVDDRWRRPKGRGRDEGEE